MTGVRKANRRLQSLNFKRAASSLFKQFRVERAQDIGRSLITVSTKHKTSPPWYCNKEEFGFAHNSASVQKGAGNRRKGGTQKYCWACRDNVMKAKVHSKVKLEKEADSKSSYCYWRTTKTVMDWSTSLPSTGTCYSGRLRSLIIESFQDQTR